MKVTGSTALSTNAHPLAPSGYSDDSDAGDARAAAAPLPVVGQVQSVIDMTAVLPVPVPVPQAPPAALPMPYSYVAATYASRLPIGVAAAVTVASEIGVGLFGAIQGVVVALRFTTSLAAMSADRTDPGRRLAISCLAPVGAGALGAAAAIIVGGSPLMAAYAAHEACEILIGAANMLEPGAATEVVEFVREHAPA